jgi:hypothetical protein
MAFLSFFERDSRRKRAIAFVEPRGFECNRLFSTVMNYAGNRVAKLFRYTCAGTGSELRKVSFADATTPCQDRMAAACDGRGSILSAAVRVDLD